MTPPTLLRSCLVFAAFALAAACSGEDPDPAARDAGTPSARDAGPTDAQVRDAGEAPDGGVADSVRATIGPEGGVLESGGVRFDVPAGALSEPVEIAMTFVSGPASAVGPVVDFNPDGLQFAVPAQLEMPYDPARIPAGATPSDVVASYLEDGQWSATLPTTLDTAHQLATASVEHFSVIGLTVRAGEAVRLDNNSMVGDRLENIVLDAEAPDYIVEVGDHPSPAFRGLIVSTDLRIDPGVRIWFEEDAAMRVVGRVIAEGTPNAPIVFEGADDRGAPGPGHWRGLFLNPRRDDSDENNVLENVVIRHAGRAWTEQNPRSVVQASIALGSHDFGVADVVDLRVVDSVIEDGLGNGIDVILDTAVYDPGAFVVERSTIRRVSGYPLALWPHGTMGLGADNTFTDNGDNRVWLRGGEVFTEGYGVRDPGVPYRVGMTDEEQDAYPGFTPERNLIVLLDMTVQPGVVFEMTPGAGVVVVGGVQGRGSLTVEGSAAMPVVFRPPSPQEAWAGISVRSSSMLNVLRHVEIDGAGTAVDVGFGNADAYVRLEDATIRNAGCGVRSYDANATAELVRVTYVNTTSETCGP
ncbi:MAG: hypothetical protein RMA76_18560 [Deltaproteobacteria bacterium]|jgi:hypothetical protein